MDFSLTLIFVVIAALASFGAGMFATRKKFRSEILKLAVDASKHDFEAMKSMDEKYELPMSVSLAFYVNYFMAIESGSPVGIATTSGVEGMKRAVEAHRKSDLQFYRDHQAIQNFFVSDEKE